MRAITENLEFNAHFRLHKSNFYLNCINKFRNTQSTIMDDSLCHNDRFIFVVEPRSCLPCFQDVTKDEVPKLGELNQEGIFINEIEEESCNAKYGENEFISPNESERNLIPDSRTNKKDEIKNDLDDNIDKEKEQYMNTNILNSSFNDKDSKTIASLSTPEKSEEKNNSDDIEEKVKGKNVNNDEVKSDISEDASSSSLFTKKPKGKKDITEEYSSAPIFKNVTPVKNTNKKTRKFNIDNMSKKLRQAMYKGLKNKFDHKLKKIASTYFNQNSNQSDNKKYLKMKLKELLKHIYIKGKRKKDKIKKYILTEEDEEFLAEIENDFNDEKLKPILNMKMKDIYIEFFTSQEYQDLIKKLRDEGNTYFYIYTFIENNKNLVKYYENAKERKKKTKKK